MAFSFLHAAAIPVNHQRPALIESEQNVCEGRTKKDEMLPAPNGSSCDVMRFDAIVERLSLEAVAPARPPSLASLRQDGIPLN